MFTSKTTAEDKGQVFKNVNNIHKNKIKTLPE